ncbi:MAG: phosphatidate cytidylyltransferase [Bacilli bacterium]|jgi:phosphatidate cytidylyltransferase
MKQRVISAIVVLGLVLPIIFVGGNLFYLAVTILAVLALRELLAVRKRERDLPFIMKVIAYLLLIMMVLNNYHNVEFIYYIDYRLLSLLLISLLLPLILYYNDKIYNINDAFFLIAAIFFLGMAFNLLILIRNFSIYYFIFIFLLITITDTFAYITGYLIGQNKIAPKISPHKTWEGFIGGSVFGTIISTFFYYDIINSDINLMRLIPIIILLTVIGQMGDLVFSAIKRYYRKKDFSSLMPGHGGVLDRLDSTIFVIIVFTLFITII